MKITVLSKEGEDTGRKADLKNSVFGIEPNDHAIYLDVKQYMANKRQGTHKTKERGDVTGSRRKIKRQKGTGTARAGDIKSPIFRGGGRAFGPAPREYSTKVNKKEKQLARYSALSYKAKENNLMVVEDFGLEEPRTREIVEIRRKLKIDGRSSLMVFSQPDRKAYLASRNLSGTKVISVSDLNTYDIMHASVVVFLEGSLKFLQ